MDRVERIRRRLGEDERRAQIIQATIDVVATGGYEHASLARIAERAGVSKGLVSHYFEDKDDLLAQAVEVAATGMRQGIVDRLDLSEAVPNVIRAAVRRVAVLNTTHPVEVKAIREITTNLRRPDGTQRIDLLVYEETYQLQERLFRRGQAEGSLREFDTRVMAVTYQGAIDTMLGYFDAHPETDVDAYAVALADLIVAAVRA